MPSRSISHRSDQFVSIRLIFWPCRGFVLRSGSLQRGRNKSLEEVTPGVAEAVRKMTVARATEEHNFPQTPAPAKYQQKSSAVTDMWLNQGSADNEMSKHLKHQVLRH
jgi:hypothetical protein